jgi:hypothetical protein
MDAATMARHQLNEAHDMIEQALDGLSDEQLQARLPGSTVAPLSLIYLHTVTGEDWVLNELIAGEQTIWENGGWAERLGLPADLPTRADWGETPRLPDIATAREYARLVYAASDEFLTSLTPAALDDVRQTSLGERSVGYLVGVWVGWHASHHGGEICALKGALGEKGLPN